MSFDSIKSPLVGAILLVVLAVTLVRGTLLLGMIVVLGVYSLYLFAQLVDSLSRIADSAERIATQLEDDR